MTAPHISEPGLPHVESAKYILERLSKHPQGRVELLMIAQIHATLAVAEQARIANLLSLSREELYTPTPGVPDYFDVQLQATQKLFCTELVEAPATPWSDPDEYLTARLVPEVEEALMGLPEVPEGS